MGVAAEEVDEPVAGKRAHGAVVWAVGEESGRPLEQGTCAGERLQPLAQIGSRVTLGVREHCPRPARRQLLDQLLEPVAQRTRDGSSSTHLPAPS